MAKYVEFIGVPGVGKTTTYNFLRTQWTKSAKWILYEELCKSKNTNGKGLRGLIKFYIKRMIEPSLALQIAHNGEVLERSFKSNPELLELFWQTIPRNEDGYGKDLRSYGVNYTMAMLEKIQNVKEENSDKFCLVDEGLTHNINYFVTHASEISMEQQVSKVLDLVELPNAAVFFNGDIKTVIARTASRGNLRPRDKGLSQQELIKSRIKSIKEKGIYVEALRLRNIPVLYLKADESVQAKSTKIISFINNLI